MGWWVNPSSLIKPKQARNNQRRIRRRSANENSNYLIWSFSQERERLAPRNFCRRVIKGFHGNALSVIRHILYEFLHSFVFLITECHLSYTSFYFCGYYSIFHCVWVRLCVYRHEIWYFSNFSFVCFYLLVRSYSSQTTIFNTLRNLKSSRKLWRVKER